MLKIIGIILIVAATTKIGFLFAARLERRKNALISFKDALSLLESEIGFAQNSLAKAFFNSIEYALKAVEIHDARHFKEFLAGSLRVGSCNALAGNDCLFREEVRCFFQCFFDAVSQVGSLSHIVVLAGTAGVKNRIEQQPCISVERFTDLFGYFMQNFFLALVREDGYFVAFLILSDFQGFFHSFFEQVGQLFIYIVYVLSHLI